MFELSRAGKPLEESPLVSSVLPMKPSDGTRCGVVDKRECVADAPQPQGGSRRLCICAGLWRSASVLRCQPNPNTVVRKQGLIAAWLGPDEWLLISALDGSVSMKSQLQSALGSLHCALNDFEWRPNHYHRLRCAASLDVLSKGCTLDLHPPCVLDPGNVRNRSWQNHQRLIIPRATNLSAYDVVVRRSFADYLWQWLIKAGNEYGVSNVA